MTNQTINREFKNHVEYVILKIPNWSTAIGKNGKKINYPLQLHIQN